jgi:hypothetical protein
MATAQPTMASFPSLGDWAAAVCSPDNFFGDDDLKSATIELDPRGLPRARSGQYAVVFRARLRDGREQAIRVFTSARTERQERYKEIHDHVEKQPLQCLVPFHFFEKGIRCKGKRYPLVTMDWVQGCELLEWLGRRVAAQDGRAIGAVAEQWQEMMAGMQKARIAHGDLQDRNVMITDAGHVKLVDYDGMCVPALVGRKTEEGGTPPYRHPQRGSDTQLTLSLDNYSSILIYVGLRALAADLQLWQRFVVAPSHDKLLFRDEDLANPGGSDLFGCLYASPDQQVKKLAKDLGDLWRGSIDAVPPLEDLLFSFDHVRVLLDQRDFDAAKALLLRNNKRPADAPAALQPRINEAIERVAKREELEKAVANCDERSMAILASQPLLQGYPRAGEPLAIAADAAAVVEVIDKLEKAKTEGKWRDFVVVWEQSRPLLTRPKGALRGSVAAYESAVRSWSERNALADQVLACLKAADPDVGRLAPLAKQLADRGGHPECEPHRAAIDLATARDAAWRPFNAVPRQVSEENDGAAAAAWRENVFVGWPPAEAERQRLEAARKRLQTAAAIRGIAGPPTRDGENEIVRLGAGLPAGWSAELAARCETARDRLAALEALHAAVAADSDTQIAAAHGALHALQATSLAAKVSGRVQTALNRAPVLAALEKIPSDYGNADASRWDIKLLAAWNESLLKDCRDAAPWMPMVDTARRRRKQLAALEALVATRDNRKAALGEEIVSDPCLAGYAFDDATTRWIEWAREVGRAVREMTAATERGDDKAFLASFDAGFLRDHAIMFQAHWQQILDWVRSGVMSAAKPQPPIGQQPLEVVAGTGKSASRCRLKWRWPERRFTDECMVVISREKPSATSVPSAVGPLLSFPVTRESYEIGGGFRTVQAKPDWKGGYITVWAKLDLGADTLWSQPLVLGRI